MNNKVTISTTLRAAIGNDQLLEKRVQSVAETVVGIDYDHPAGVQGLYQYVPELGLQLFVHRHARWSAEFSPAMDFWFIYGWQEAEPLKLPSKGGVLGKPGMPDFSLLWTDHR